MRSLKVSAGMNKEMGSLAKRPFAAKVKKLGVMHRVPVVVEKNISIAVGGLANGDFHPTSSIGFSEDQRLEAEPWEGLQPHRYP